MSVGENIRHLRRQKGLSQTAFAQLVGTTQETVSRWERDAIFLRKDSLTRIAAACDVTVEEILGGPRAISQALDADEATCASAEKTKATLLAACQYPCYRIIRSGNGTTLARKGSAYAPPDIAQRHPNALFVVMDSGAMNKVYPAGSLLLVDPQVAPYNGCSVVVLVDDSNVVIRRYMANGNAAMLSTWSHERGAPDLIVEQRSLRLCGVVVWYQAARDVEGA